MLTPIAIQPVRSSDIDVFLSLSVKTFYDAFAHLNNPEDFEAYTSVAFTRDQLLSEMENPDSAFYFALTGEEKVGYIKLNYGPAQAEFQHDPSVEISRIYILAGQQGKQIGRQLLDFAIAKAVEAKLQYIWLGVWENNVSAQRFYERNGFVKFSSHEFVVGTDVQTDILMKKEL